MDALQLPCRSNTSQCNYCYNLGQVFSDKAFPLPIFVLGSPFQIWALFNASNARRVSLKDATRLEGYTVVYREWVSDDVISNRYRFSDIHDDSTQMTQRKAMELAQQAYNYDVGVEELASINQMIIPHLPLMQKAREVIEPNRSNYSQESTLHDTEPVGLWIVGASGTGKSVLIRDFLKAVNSRRPNSVYETTIGRTNGFWQGLKETHQVIFVDEFSFDRLPANDILNLVSTGNHRLNVKGSHVELTEFILLIICCNFPLDHFLQDKKKVKDIDPHAVRRRFTEIRLGSPSSTVLNSVHVNPTTR